MSSFQGRRNWNRGETRGVRIGIEDRGVGGGGGGGRVGMCISFYKLSCFTVSQPHDETQCNHGCHVSCCHMVVSYLSVF